MTNEKQKPQMDWQQVVLNGGPPCFFVEGPQYCGRAERWPGHGNEAFHDYVSLDELLATVRAEERKAALRDAVLLVDTAPLCHCAGKQYIDPVALVQRMNAALEDAVENRKGEG